MTHQTDLPSLTQLNVIPYVDETGYLPQFLDGKIGVYGIF
jgi:hypothetical protein